MINIKNDILLFFLNKIIKNNKKLIYILLAILAIILGLSFLSFKIIIISIAAIIAIFLWVIAGVYII